MALDGRLMAVPSGVEAADHRFEAGTPTALFPAHPARAVEHIDGPQYVVSADGQRFLVNTVADEPAPPPISVIVNWQPKD